MCLNTLFVDPVIHYRIFIAIFFIKYFIKKHIELFFLFLI